jgi:hypothetical protein
MKTTPIIIVKSGLVIAAIRVGHKARNSRAKRVNRVLTTNKTTLLTNDCYFTCDSHAAAADDILRVAEATSAS